MGHKKEKSTVKPIDWSDKKRLEVLIESRKIMWNEDYVAFLAKLIGLKPGKTIADIGCGFGYLGHLYGKFIMPKGKYIGVDQNKKLLQMADKSVTSRKLGKSFKFMQGSALKIPLEDESVDVAMCQTLLMHLKEPESAVRELIRITKKHGKIVAFEPNALSWTLSQWSNFREIPRKELLENIDYSYRICEGKEKLGFGDARIGEKVPYLFMKNGLKNIQVRLNEKVWGLIPPYNTPELKHFKNMALENMKKNRKKTRGEKRKESLEEKKYYLAGGGDARTFKRLELRRRRLDKNHKKLVQWINKEKLYSIGSGDFYITIGEKQE